MGETTISFLIYNLYAFNKNSKYINLSSLSPIQLHNRPQM